jgi:hypothetical protein
MLSTQEKTNRNWGNRFSNFPNYLLDQSFEPRTMIINFIKPTKIEKSVIPNRKAKIAPTMENIGQNRIMAIPGRPASKALGTSTKAIARNDAVNAQRYLGRTLWRRWSGYHRRSRVETKRKCIV